MSDDANHDLATDFPELSQPRRTLFDFEAAFLAGVCKDNLAKMKELAAVETLKPSFRAKLLARISSVEKP